ncbi:unnamed protein product [Adineta steineri]|uniref:Uncharacterized protein n=1 Tax=Adineta steineri TaxID=433720 RepID=A0A815RKD2_9BILA|nr:unnamed protein product [Adineta steineri]CAF4038165.1 unnamed protein product [Adineta steineri]
MSNLKGSVLVTGASGMLGRQPNAIVHCAGERRPGMFEKEPNKATFFNVNVTQNLAEIAGDNLKNAHFNPSWQNFKQNQYFSRAAR